MEFLSRDLVVTRMIAALFIPRGSGTPIHKNRPSHGFAFNLSCTVNYRFGPQEVLTCRAGELIYLPKGSNYIVEHGIEPEADRCGVYAINFLTDLEQNENRPFVTRPKGTEAILSHFSKATSAWSKKDVGYYEECMSHLYQIVRLLKSEQAAYAPLEKSVALLQPALDYIGKNFTTEAISVAHLASLCGMSEPYLRRLFRRAFAVSPAVYVRDQRIKHAKELLASGEYTVTNVAALSGFNDVSYFTREFKKSTGLPPTEYK